MCHYCLFRKLFVMEKFITEHETNSTVNPHQPVTFTITEQITASIISITVPYGYHYYPILQMRKLAGEIKQLA